MTMNKTPLTECVKKSIMGILPAVDAKKDLLFKKDFQTNSWWVGGDYDVNGHELAFVYHIMTCEIPGMGVIFSYRFTFTDVTDGLYIDTGEKAFPMDAITVSEDKFSIVVPAGMIEGDFDKMIVKMRESNCAVDIQMKALGYPLYNGGDGTFQWQGTTTHQISIPTMETTGSITINGKTYQLKNECYSWFDRQWQNHDPNPARLTSLAWIWMCIKLKSGDVVSVWSNPVDGVENSFATIKHPDGTHTVTYAGKPVSDGITEYWHSNKSGKNWPVGWVVELPEFDAEFRVNTFPYNQEMYSEMKTPGSCYEGISKVSGKYKGEEVDARCFVEITGDWSEHCIKAAAREVK